MVDNSTASNEAKGGSTTSAILGWGSLALATIGFIWFISTQLSVGWEGREKEALSLARAYQGEGMKYKLDDHKIEVQNEARRRGEFIGTFSWETTHVEGPLYRVSLTWMEGSQHKKAVWNVDLKKKTIEPAGQEAVDFMKRSAGEG